MYIEFIVVIRKLNVHVMNTCIIHVYMSLQEVKVGSNYQARVPEIRKKPSNNSAANSSHAHSSTPSSSVSSNSTNCSRHDNSSTYPVGELVWSPKGTSEAEGMCAALTSRVVLLQ